MVAPARASPHVASIPARPHHPWQVWVYCWRAMPTIDEARNLRMPFNYMLLTAEYACEWCLLAFFPHTIGVDCKARTYRSASSAPQVQGKNHATCRPGSPIERCQVHACLPMLFPWVRLATEGNGR